MCCLARCPSSGAVYMLGLAAGVKTMLRSAQEIQEKKAAETAGRYAAVGRGREERKMATEAHGANRAVWSFTRWTSSSSSRFSATARSAWYTLTNATLWMALAVLATFALMVLGTSHARRSSRADAVGRRTGLWLYLQDGRRRGRQGRGQVFPLYHDAVHVHRLRQLPRPAADCLHAPRRTSR